MNVVSETGWLDVLNAWVASGKPARIRLFANDHDPDPIDTTGEYVQATFSGYPGYTPLAWGAAFINGTDQGQVNAAQVSWTHSGGINGQLVYGVYITDDDDNLQYAEKFTAPVSMTAAGQTLEYQPRVTLINQ